MTQWLPCKHLPAVVGAAVPVAEQVKPEDQFNRMQQHFLRADREARGVMLTAYCKMSVMFGGAVAGAVTKVMGSMSSAIDAELQQRAVEYGVLPGLSATVRSAVCSTKSPVLTFRHAHVVVYVVAWLVWVVVCSPTRQTLETVLQDMPPFQNATNVLERLNEARKNDNANKKSFLGAEKAAGNPEEEGSSGDEGDVVEESKGPMRAATPPPPPPEEDLLGVYVAAAVCALCVDVHCVWYRVRSTALSFFFG